MALLVIDLDDTILVGTTHLYARPITESAHVIIDELGARAPHISAIIAKGQEVDSRRVHEVDPKTGEKFLYSQRRFPGSQVELYRYYCRKAGVEPRKAVERQLWKIGMQAFDPFRYHDMIHDAAGDVLSFLKKQGHALILCTKGDRAIQQDKINALHVAGIHQFDETYIVDTKKPATFSSIRRGRDISDAVTIGNSYGSDIVPALQSGYRGVLIPTATWEGTVEDMLEQVDDHRCTILDDFSELKTRYEEWM